MIIVHGWIPYTTQLTWCNIAHHSCIFSMTTVVSSNTKMWAVGQACLSTSAGHFIVVDWTTALTEGGTFPCRCSSAVTKLPTHHIGISDVPTVIAHSAPCTIVVHLHTSLIVTGTSNQANGALLQHYMYGPKSPWTRPRYTNAQAQCTQRSLWNAHAWNYKVPKYGRNIAYNCLLLKVG